MSEDAPGQAHYQAEDGSLRPVLASDRPTPMMAQYIEIKAANPDCLLFYRMGDFYELFFGDAEIASRTLGIVLTKRGKHLGEDIPMCGVPVVRADEYLQRLIAAGHRVAVCEQTEDPAEARKRGAKSVVRRDVVRLVTPGTITEETLLDPGRANLLVSVARAKRSDARFDFGVAAADISTGAFTLHAVDSSGLPGLLARLDPSEILLPDVVRDDPDLAGLWRDLKCPVAPLAREGFDAVSAAERLARYFGVATLDSFGSFSRAELAAAGAIIAYVERTQLSARPPLQRPVREGAGTTVEIDAATRANLELVRTLSGERAGSLLATIDRTLTPAGGRLLAERLAAPLAVLDGISDRLDSIALLVDDDVLRGHLRQLLRRAPDMPRALARLALQRGGPRDLAAILEGLRTALDIGARVGPLALAELGPAQAALATQDRTIVAELTTALGDDLPLLRRDGGFVRPGFSHELDEAMRLAKDSRAVINGLTASYAERTECRTLRIKHNNILGYFIEVPQAVGEKLVQPPFNATFIHRQTMAGAMRFSTSELAELESRIASAADRALALELAIFDRLASRILYHEPAIRAASEALAVLDVSAGLADLAADRGWRRPALSQGLDFHIEGGRHPVVEASVRARGESFVANGCDLTKPGSDAGNILLVTGPNMAGKSTYLRQNALIAVLAQMGSFVPADACRIGLVDRLFSRVGAADDLARGRSTFMVEMVETAAILNQATGRSLVILDEIGRGTATYDGLSIAWATIEHLHEKTRCRALFATHFHELTALARRLSRLQPVTMRVTEHRGDVVFLHEVIPGAADRSYGIQVAKLAGLPSGVVARARQVLAELERNERASPALKLVDDLPLFAFPAEADARAAAGHKDALRDALAEIDPDEMTPREAHDALYRLKQIGVDKDT